MVRGYDLSKSVKTETVLFKKLRRWYCVITVSGGNVKNIGESFFLKISNLFELFSKSRERKYFRNLLIMLNFCLFLFMVIQLSYLNYNLYIVISKVIA
jgi:hypothetical protein